MKNICDVCGREINDELVDVKLEVIDDKLDIKVTDTTETSKITICSFDCLIKFFRGYNYDSDKEFCE